MVWDRLLESLRAALALLLGRLWGEPYASVMKAALELRYRCRGTRYTLPPCRATVPLLWPPNQPQSAHPLAVCFVACLCHLARSLLPYHYSLAHAMYSTGRLWMRALAAAYPDEPAALTQASQWLDGALLVAPILTNTSRSDVHLPAGTWFGFNTSKMLRGPANVSSVASLTEVPIFAPAGAVVPLAPAGLQYTQALPGGPLEVQVYAGSDGDFVLVEDDGETRAYERATAGTRTTTFRWCDRTHTLSWHVEEGEMQTSTHAFTHAFTHVRVVLFSLGETRTSEVQLLGRGGHATLRPRGRLEE